MYRPCVVDAVLTDRLTSAGAVLLEGPKACGKTFTAEQQAASRVDLDTDDQARAALGIDPALVLSGTPPQLVDEWQLDATRVWNHVRAEVDRRQGTGLYILSEPATLAVITATGYGYTRPDGVVVIPAATLGP